MKDRLEELRREALAAAQDASCTSTLQEVEASFLGKKGQLTQILKGLGALSAEERPAAGQLANQVKNDITTAFVERTSALKLAAFEKELAPGSFDPTLPGPGPSPGGMHPVDLITRELEDLFLTMGFQVADGPEVELETNNFDSLNIQADHPAREAHDTIWVQRASQDSVGLCMRTHTSPVQIRALQEMGAPLRVIAPGRVFRQESLDATHEHTFHQMEGLMVDKGIAVPHLLHVMNTLIEGVFGKVLETRLRPGYFPFVEPGFELDARCSFCETGCKVCKGTRWIELIGCGMVHPKVLEMSGVDPEIHSGFAFGLGLSRIAMLRYGIEDIRWMMGGSIPFLSQFRK